jgi:putative DNA-invertase from lambdoid prophage Rac
VSELLAARPRPGCADVATASLEDRRTWVHSLDSHPELGEPERHALRRGRTVRRGQGYSLHVTALPDVHRVLLAAAAELGAGGAPPAARKAYRIYIDRLTNAAASTVPA